MFGFGEAPAAESSNFNMGEQFSAFSEPTIVTANNESVE
jgi:hypothetical protein